MCILLCALCFVTATKLEGKEAAGGTAHAGVEESHHGHHAAHHAVDAVVLDAKGGEDHTRRVEPHNHGEEHADVEHQRVAGYAAVG